MAADGTPAPAADDTPAGPVTAAPLAAVPLAAVPPEGEPPGSGLGPLGLIPVAAQPWLPWLALGLVAGAAGLADARWWWLVAILAPLAALLDRRFPTAARVAVFAAALCAGGWLGGPRPPPDRDPGPRLLAVTGTVSLGAWQGYGQGFVVDVDWTDDPAGHRPWRLFVTAGGTPDVRDGDRVAARGTWTRDGRGERLDAVAVERVVPREEGPRGAAWRAVERVAGHPALAGSLLLGQGSPPEKELFRRTGLIHLLAVSGMNLALAAALGAWLLRLAGVPWTWRQVALGVLLVGYTWLTAASPATVRALAMGLAMLLYALLAREPHRLGAVSLAALALVLWDPPLARDLGFQLSLAAVLGLLTLGADLMHLRERLLPLAAWPLDRPLWRLWLFTVRSAADGLCIGLAATLATAPLLAMTFGTVSPWSALTTLLAAPPTTLAQWTGLPLLALAGAWPDGPWEGLYRVLEWSLDALVWAVHVADRLPGRVAVPVPPLAVMLLFPLAFLPCEPPWVPLGDTVRPFPWRTVSRLGVVAVVLGLWWLG